MSVAPLLGNGTPERPGPGPMPIELLRALEIDIGRRIEGMLAGDYRSSCYGEGAELAQVRPYVPGDDVRQIEWNVTARTGEPHVRVQLAERVLVTWLVLDTSPSMHFGTGDRRKADVAEGVALAIGHVATPPRQPPRRRHLRRQRAEDAAARTGPARADRPARRAPARAARTQRVGATSLGEALARADAIARQRGARRRRLRLPRPARLAQAAARADEPPRRPRRRDPRPARAGASRRRRALARRPGDRPPAPRRHARARSCAPASPPRPPRSGAASRACWRRSASRTSSSRPPATGCARFADFLRRPPVSFGRPLALVALAAVPLLVVLWLRSTGGAARAPRASRASRSCRTSSTAGPGRLRLVPPALFLLGAGGADRRRRPAAREDPGPASGGDGHARDRHLPLDEGDRRPADAARRGEGRRERVPREGAEASTASRSSHSAAAPSSPCRRRSTAPSSATASTISCRARERRSATPSSSPRSSGSASAPSTGRSRRPRC